MRHRGCGSQPFAAKILNTNSAFLLGAILLHEPELANHFFKISTLFLSMPEIIYARTQPETARLVMLSYIYNLYYLMMNQRFGSIASLWQKATDFFLLLTEKYFEQSCQEECVII